MLTSVGVDVTLNGGAVTVLDLEGALLLLASGRLRSVVLLLARAVVAGRAGDPQVR